VVPAHSRGRCSPRGRVVYWASKRTAGFARFSTSVSRRNDHTRRTIAHGRYVCMCVCVYVCMCVCRCWPRRATDDLRPSSETFFSSTMLPMCSRVLSCHRVRSASDLLVASVWMSLFGCVLMQSVDSRSFGCDCARGDFPGRLGLKLCQLFHSSHSSRARAGAAFPLCLVGNLPFGISTPLLIQLLRMSAEK
jgi:hypothetical protein